VSQPIHESAAPILERLRARFGRRAAGIVLALLMEGLLVLLLLTIGQSDQRPRELRGEVVTFETAPVPAPEPDTPETDRRDPESNEAPPPPEPEQPQPDPAPQVPPPRAPLIELSRNEMEAANIVNLHPSPAPPAPARRSPMGPPDTGGTTSDTARVGTAPNGSPLYAASWYREPRNDELAGYLSTAEGPGWALIACRTVPDYRVEDCVALQEYPRGSQIARSVLAAAWQFRVRPPWRAGQSQVGDWVRIRIDYDIRRR